MQQHIRLNVFETNSSSSHSLTVTAGDLVETPFDVDTLRRGVVEVGMSEYGWEWQRYYTARNKLSYLLTQVLRYHGNVPTGTNAGVTKELCEEHDELAMMVRVVKDYTGCDLHFVADSSGYIDHESAGEGMELFRSEDQLKQFLFSASSFVQTGNDNEGPPARIETDKPTGAESFYAKHHLDPQASWVSLRFQCERDYGDLKLALDNGVILSSESNDQLLQALIEQGTVVQVDIEEQGHYSYYEHTEPRSDRMSALAELGLKFSADLTVTTKFQKISYQDKTKERYHRQTYTIAMPAELAGQIQALTA